MDALEAVDVRDLVRIADDRGRAARDDRPRELLDLHHRALDVHVAVDEARKDEPLLEVDLLLPLVPLPYTDDAFTEYRDV